MSEPDPRDAYRAKTRNPLDADNAFSRDRGKEMKVSAMTFIYIAICMALAGAAAYMHMVQGVRLMDPRVLFSSLGAVWFFFRAVFSVIRR
jgi:hypothetical protein